MPQKSVEELYKIIELQQNQIVELQRKVKQLEAELRKYNNENTPTSAIPYYEKENSNKRHKQSGQKEGHKGISRKKPDKIDRIEELTLETSPCCNAEVKKMEAKPKSRRVIILKMPELENVVFLKNRYICTCCGKEVQPQPPNTLPNSRFDLSFMILLSFLSVGLNIPFGKIRELLKFLWGLDVSEATISNTLVKLSEFLGAEYEKLKKEIKEAVARYNDETGWRILGKGSWLWVFISDKVALYTIEQSRGKKVVRKILGKKADGVDVTDGLKSYEELQSRKQKCWAHLLRRFKQIVFPFKNKREKRDFRKLKNSLKLILKRAKEDKAKRGVSVKLREKYEKKLDMTLAKKYKGIHCNFMVGLPNETMQTVDETIRLIRDVVPHSVHVSTFFVVPYTDVHVNAKRYGIEFLDPDWIPNLHKFFGDSSYSYFRHRTMTQDDMRAAYLVIRSEVEKMDAVCWNLKDHLLLSWLSVGGTETGLKRIWRNPSEYLDQQELDYFEAFKERSTRTVDTEQNGNQVIRELALRFK